MLNKSPKRFLPNAVNESSLSLSLISNEFVNVAKESSFVTTISSSSSVNLKSNSEGDGNSPLLFLSKVRCLLPKVRYLLISERDSALLIMFF